MSTNEKLRQAQYMSMPVPAGKKAGDPVRIGGLKRSDPTTSVRLSSGDVCLLAGEARLYHHGVDRILPGSSRLVPGGGRFNLTLRRAAPA